MGTSRRSSSLAKLLPPTFGRRHLQCLLMFVGFAAAFSMRVNLSVAIVAMMDRKAANPDFPEYHWSEETKSRILSSFFWGYICTQIPGGMLARRFGGKVMLLSSLSISSIMALLTPLGVAYGDWKLLCFMRFLQGFGQGVTVPSMHTLLAKWAPVTERGSLATYAYSGAQFGTVIMLASSGLLASSSMGWPSCFYIPGGLGLTWTVLWIIWGASSPSECKKISVAERALIEGSLQQNTKSHDDDKPNLPIPWKSIFTSVPFLVLMATHCASTWCFWTLLTQIPTYMKSVLGKDIKSNALLSALPYFTMLILGLACGPLSDFLEKGSHLSATTSRKIFNSIGQWVPVLTLIWLGYITREQADLAVFLLTFTVSISTTMHLGWQVNHIDLAPNFAGTLVSLTNCAANVCSIIAPLIVGFVVTDTSNPNQWRIIFFMVGGINFFGNLMFVLFGTAKVQPWNSERETKVTDSKVDAEKAQEMEPLNEETADVPITKAESQMVV
ncbi:LOW QUALITY PROTEIN: putative inorganic phosphate cotransporter [Bactrocera neohumeralis]|uniref:putative inorganic phosphate cotransporter n=1 Tax=Bactrocera tryoni TaxID=59916 RepID=UPI001A978735|nr:putative inorganic phosphate cotransporter [Bactrocera tryoni]XP_050326852.1 LOW QUALITY PROTEIN: putative inorganic phosphate cotransporter [Bactrocera neohumeralis]